MSFREIWLSANIFIISVLIHVTACSATDLVSDSDAKLVKGESDNLGDPTSLPSTSERSATLETSSEELLTNIDLAAAEPVMIGGGFLACFEDRDIQDSDFPESTSDGENAIGCSIYVDDRYQERLAVNEVSVQNATLHTGPESQNLTLFDLTNHPRWDWIGKVPSSSSSRLITIDFFDGLSVPSNVSITVPLHFNLTAGITFLAINSLADYKIVLDNTNECIGGNPVWLRNNSNQYRRFQLEAVSCDASSALNFRVAPFANGFRIHTHNPNPALCFRPAGVGFCNRSSIDLVNFGRGNLFELFAFTESEEAQSLSITLNPDSTISLSANNKSLVIENNLAVAFEDIVEQEPTRFRLVRQ